MVGSGSAISVLTTLLVGGWSPAGSSIVLCSCVCREPLQLLVGVPPAGDNGAASCLPKGLHRRRLPSPISSLSSLRPTLSIIFTASEKVIVSHMKDENVPILEAKPA